MSRILVVADQPRAAAVLDRGLRAAGFTATLVRDATGALEQVYVGGHDLLLIDVGQPPAHGLAMVRHIKERGGTIPVIMLVPRGPEPALGLAPLTVDSFDKPFRFDDLVARIHRRLQPSTRPPRVTVLHHGDLALDLRTGRASVGRRAVPLSEREVALAEAFLRQPGVVLSREELLSRAWGYDFDPSSNVVDVYIGYLRRKLGPGRIQTVRGVGYRLVDASRQLTDRRPSVGADG